MLSGNVERVLLCVCNCEFILQLFGSAQIPLMIEQRRRPSDCSSKAEPEQMDGREPESEKTTYAKRSNGMTQHLQGNSAASQHLA